MAIISIEESHSLGTQEAQRRLDEYVNELTQGAFPGVTIDDVQKQWDGPRLETSFRAKKGFFSKRVNGSMQIAASSVTLEVEVPDLVFSLVPRKEVESVIRQKLRARLV
ncbi:MAG: polyhydroxyalkanoic acid system family protein [Bryobacterales bacterium]